MLLRETDATFELLLSLTAEVESGFRMDKSVLRNSHSQSIPSSLYISIKTVRFIISHSQIGLPYALHNLVFVRKLVL